MAYVITALIAFGAGYGFKALGLTGVHAKLDAITAELRRLRAS